MSKLRDRMRDLSKRAPRAAFGFAPTRVADAPTRQMLVIAEAATPSDVGIAAAAGADAVVYTGGLNLIAEAKTTSGASILGVRIDAATAADAAALVEAGADFLVCADDRAEAAALTEQKLGYLVVAPGALAPGLQPEGMDDDSLRLMRALDLDGVLIPAPPVHMTVRQQLHTRRLGDLVRKALFARVDGDVPVKTLELWRDAGVVAVVCPTDSVGALVASVGAVPAPRQPTDRREAVVPMSPKSTQLDDDEE